MVEWLEIIHPVTIEVQTPFRIQMRHQKLLDLGVKASAPIQQSLRTSTQAAAGS
jgi:hypothetical protein